MLIHCRYASEIVAYHLLRTLVIVELLDFLLLQFNMAFAILLDLTVNYYTVAVKEHFSI